MGKERREIEVSDLVFFHEAMTQAKALSIMEFYDVWWFTFDLPARFGVYAALDHLGHPSYTFSQMYEMLRQLGSEVPLNPIQEDEPCLQ